MTTGAGNDLERSTELARKMVCEWGMSDAMGPLTFGKKEEQIFLGREIAQHQDYSEDTAIRIDHEIKRFVTTNYERARGVLEKHKPALLRIAEELLAREVLDAEQVRRILAGEAARRAHAAATSSSADGRWLEAASEGTAVDGAAAAAAEQAAAAGIDQFGIRRFGTSAIHRPRRRPLRGLFPVTHERA